MKITTEFAVLAATAIATPIICWIVMKIVQSEEEEDDYNSYYDQEFQ